MFQTRCPCLFSQRFELSTNQREYYSEWLELLWPGSPENWEVFPGKRTGDVLTTKPNTKDQNVLVETKYRNKSRELKKIFILVLEPIDPFVEVGWETVICITLELIFWCSHRCKDTFAFAAENPKNRRHGWSNPRVEWKVQKSNKKKERKKEKEGA